MSAAAVRFAPFRAVFAARIESYKQWIVIGVVALLFVIMPQVPINDWMRNAADLPHGLALYHDPAYVYPPWALILMLPYYLIGAAGSRVASVLLIGWLAQRRGWSLGQFLAVILAPLFLWTMVLSNSDILILVLPILLWELEGSRQSVLRGLALAILLLKPQITILLLLYWLWTMRRQPRNLLIALIVMVALTLPISLIGSPPLLAQWIADLVHPGGENLDLWNLNNLSLSYRYGLLIAVPVVTLVFSGLFLWVRRRGKPWKHDYSYSVLLTISMLLAPYASNQSAIVPISLRPSWRVTVLQYLGIFGAVLLNAYKFVDVWLVLSLVVLSIVFAAQSDPKTEKLTEEYAQTN